MTLGENIKSIRKKRGIKQSELASKLEVTVRTIQNYESGNREPNMETLIKICNILDCAPMEIIDLVDFEKLPETIYDNNTPIIPSSFEEVKDTVNKTFPTLEPMIQLLTNPKIEIVYNYSYNDLAACGYEELLFVAIEKTIKTTLSEIKEHEEREDLFDGFSWISKESPVYEILKKSQEDNKKAMNEMIEKAEQQRD